jgi:hypothetical protein
LIIRGVSQIEALHAPAVPLSSVSSSDPAFLARQKDVDGAAPSPPVDVISEIKSDSDSKGKFNYVILLFAFFTVF